jgi:hypothetical protein
MRIMPATILVNPGSDVTFKRLAEAHASNGADTPADLEDRLRERYPRASVVQGISGDSTERWYVYRDGRWIDSEARSRRTTRSTRA